MVNDVDKDFDQIVANWLDLKIEYPKIQANNIPETLEYLFDTYHN